MEGGFMSDSPSTGPEVPTPSPAMRELGDRLVGTFRLTGGAEGTSRFEWLEGGFFLVQHVDLNQSGMHIKGIEIIGNLRPFGEEPSEEIRSRFFDNMGNTLDYVYELEGDTLTIWGGEKGSPAYCRADLSPDGSSTGEWVYPGGGGYRFTSTRVS
jgi:hypothetical protein